TDRVLRASAVGGRLQNGRGTLRRVGLRLGLAAGARSANGPGCRAGRVHSAGAESQPLAQGNDSRRVAFTDDALRGRPCDPNRTTPPTARTGGSGNAASQFNRRSVEAARTSNRPGPK